MTDADIPIVSVGDVQRSRQALVWLHEETGQFLNESGMDPTPESIAAKEQADTTKAEKLFAAYSRGHLLLESAADHVFALSRLLVEPVQTMAPWTCVRASLESAAFSCWLLSERIDSQERIGRNLTFQYEELSQQLKLARVTGDEESLRILEAKMGKAKAEALSLGHTRVVRKNHKRAGIALRVPSATDCIRDMLGEEKWYRTFSAVTHGHSWAISQLSFRVLDLPGLTALEKSLRSDGAALLLILAADALAKPVWTKASLFGYDLKRLSRILENRYGQMGLTERRHFWIRK